MSTRPHHAGSVGLAWSGGKDSALALHQLRRDGVHVAALLTTFTEGYERVSMHGVRRELVRRQAAAAGVPLVEVTIPPDCVNATYEERMAAAFGAPPLEGIAAMASGDLFLEDVRAYREERLAAAGKDALFPLWGRDTRVLANEFVEAGFEALVCCLDPDKLDPSFAGRSYDAEFLADLPEGVDRCGERGEFHTFVHAGPVLATPVDVRVVGDVVERDGFVFCDLVARD
ncbi:MAG: ATP-binding protein [Gaiellaceae bacterium]